MAFGDMLRFAALALAPLAGAAIPGVAAAQQVSGDLHAGTLEVPINKSQVVSTDRPIAKAMVGSSEIADILPITDRSIYVLGKKMGTTSLTLYDAGGRVLAIMDVAVGPDVEAFRDQAAQLIPGAHFGRFDGPHRSRHRSRRGRQGNAARKDVCGRQSGQHDQRRRQPAGDAGSPLRRGQHQRRQGYRR